MALSSIPSVHLVGSWCVEEENPASDSSVHREFHKESGYYEGFKAPELDLNYLQTILNFT